MTHDYCSFDVRVRPGGQRENGVTEIMFVVVPLFLTLFILCSLSPPPPLTLVEQFSG